LSKHISARGRDGLALLAGGLLPLAFAPLHWAWLVIPLLAVLLWTWQGASPRRAAWRGFLFGLGLYGVGVSWVYVSLHYYGSAPAAFAAFITALLIAYLAFYPALTAYLLNRFFPRAGALPYLLAAPALWVILDWLRSWILLSGFPWLALGYSQTDSLLAAYAPLFGVYGLSAVLLFGAGLLLTLLTNRPDWRAGLALTALALIYLGGYKASEWHWVEPAGEPIRISMIQGNIEQKQKWLPETLDATLALYAEHSVAVAPESDLIIWPETAIPLFYEDLDPGFKSALEQQAQRSQTDYLIGAPSGSWDSMEFYNGVLAISAESAAVGGFYQKRRLLPFGEYLPLRALFDLFHRFVDIPMADFTAGAAEQPLLQVAGQFVGVSICFEAAFGSEVRRALPQASLLVNVSNDGWFGRSLAAEQHLQIARMRALESGRPMARATNTGISALIDERGQLLQRGSQFVVDVLQGELQPMQGETPYVRYGDTPALLILAAMLALAFAQVKSDKRVGRSIN
jgi:apolipoprotein N-acyltransferase